MKVSYTETFESYNKEYQMWETQVGDRKTATVIGQYEDNGRPTFIVSNDDDGRIGSVSVYECQLILPWWKRIINKILKK